MKEMQNNGYKIRGNPKNKKKYKKNVNFHP